MKFVLIHSPVLGPVSWRWVAEELEAAGHLAVVPDLRDAVHTGQPTAFIDAAVAQGSSIRGGAVVVGHSGAGMFLPSIAKRVDARHTIYVDAGLPPAMACTPGGDFLDQLRSLATGGVLPAWSTWWGDGVMEELVPDETRRSLIEAEMPEVPVAFYETPIDLPNAWFDAPSSMVLLSEAYRDDANRAAALGWKVVEHLGAHLDLVSRSSEISRLVHDLREQW